MTVHDDAEFVDGLRDLAESAMIDECLIERPSTAPPVLNENTGEEVAPPPTTLYRGMCRVLPFSGGSAQSVGEQRLTLATLSARLPYTVSDLEPGDLFTVTDSADPRLVGRAFVVESIGASSGAVHRELIVSDDQG